MNFRSSRPANWSNLFSAIPRPCGTIFEWPTCASACDGWPKRARNAGQCILRELRKRWATANSSLLRFSIPHSACSIPRSFFSPVSGILFSYAVAAVVVGVGMLVAGVWKMPSFDEMARQVSMPRDNRGDDPSRPNDACVGRITGMVDCVWEGTGIRGQGSGESENDLHSSGHRPEGLVGGREAGGEGGLHLHSPVHLADTFVLRTGLAEITYDTGAKVILQGPVTYQVNSVAGGYLAVGRLTARLGERGEGRGKRERSTGVRSTESRRNCRYLFFHPSFSIQHSAFLL